MPNITTNHKNYNFLGFDCFKKGLFSTNSLAKTVCYWIVCYWTVCYRTVQKANHIQRCSSKQPITFKVVIAWACACAWFCVFAFVF